MSQSPRAASLAATHANILFAFLAFFATNPGFLHLLFKSRRLRASAVDPALSIVIRKLQIVNSRAGGGAGESAGCYNDIQSLDFLANADSPATVGTLVFADTLRLAGTPVPPNQTLLNTA